MTRSSSLSPCLLGRIPCIERGDAKTTSSRLRFPLTDHARLRMLTRCVSSNAVNAALLYGRVIQTRGAEIYVIGRKEIVRYAAEGIDLSRYHGVQVVCSLDGGVMTVYRNRRVLPRPNQHWRRQKEAP